MKKKGLLLIFFTALVSGFSIFINKFGVSGINSNIFTFAKNIIVAVFLFSILIFFNNFKDIKKLTKKQWSLLIVIGLIGGSIPFLLFFKGLQLTSGATAAFIHKTMFIYVAIFAIIFLKEKLKRAIVIPAILLLGGNFLLLKFTFDFFNIGVLLILSATLFWAAENTISKHALKQLKGNIVAFGRMFFGSLFILIYLILNKEIFLIASLTLSQLQWILLTSVFLLLYVTLWYNGLKYVKVTTATSILLLGSPITSLLNYFFLGVILTINQIIGILLIITSVMIITLFLEKRTYPTISTA